MCVLCQEEDLYFLYLEQMERAAKAQRGETDGARANWMWPSFAQPAAAAAPGLAFTPAAVPAPAASTFVCDEPDSE